MAAVVNSQPATGGGPGSSTVRVRPKERACLKVTASFNRELQAHVSIKRTQAAVPSRADHCGVILHSTCSPPRAAKQVDRCATRNLSHRAHVRGVMAVRWSTLPVVHRLGSAMVGGIAKGARAQKVGPVHQQDKRTFKPDRCVFARDAFECDDVIRGERTSAESQRAEGCRIERPLLGCFVTPCRAF